MTASAALAAHLNGKPATPTGDDLRGWLTDNLGLAEIGRHVTGAHVFGRGPSASVDVVLDEGKITFDRFADITKPSALTAHLVTFVGVYRVYKGAEAGAVAAAIFKLAQHHDQADQDDAVREFGSEFLRLAPVLEVNMDDQADRWRAFASLARLSPARDAGEDRSAATLAAACTVLMDPASGLRYVRAGWLQTYVKREVGSLYSPAALTTAMARVGWTRPNTQGRVKATNPSDNRALAWSFFVVEPGWETEGNPAEVTPSYLSNARVHTHAREAIGELAVTRNRPLSAITADIEDAAA